MMSEAEYFASLAKGFGLTLSVEVFLINDVGLSKTVGVRKDLIEADR